MSYLSSFLRARRGKMSREALADLAQAAAPDVRGLQRNAIDRWENDEAIPSAAQLEAMFRALDVTDDDRLEVLRNVVLTPASETDVGPDSGDPPAAA